VRKRGSKVGRPSKYTPELAALICKRIAEGESLRSICGSKGMPSRNAVRRWLAENSEFRIQHAVARDFMVDSLAEEALHWAKTATNKNANARRIYVDAIKWYTGKVAPKKYGDKLDMNVTGQVTIGDAIEEGRKRVARMRDGRSSGT
jgi:hypothetical protein